VDVVGAGGLTLGDAGAALLGLGELCFGSCGSASLSCVASL